jgi:hypothetical protein
MVASDGSNHSHDRADNNDFQVRIDQLALTGGPVDRRTMDELAGQAQVRLGLRADEPEVLLGFVQQLLDLSRRQQQQRDPTSSVRPDPSPIRNHPNGEMTTANDISSPLFPSDSSDQLRAPNSGVLERGMLKTEQCSGMNETIAAEIHEAGLFATGTSSLRDVPVTVPDMPLQRQPFASRTNAPTPNRAVQDGDDGTPPRPNLASVPEPPSPSLSSSAASSSRSDKDDERLENLVQEEESNSSTKAALSSYCSEDSSNYSIPSPADDHLRLEGLLQDDRWSEQEPQFPFGTALLQRDNRLGCVLKGLRFEAIRSARDSGIAPEILVEAKLVTHSGIFPSEFRWEALQSCFRNLDGRVAIDVLWLSPSVFVSTLEFKDGNPHLHRFDRPSFHDCSVEFWTRDSEEPLEIHLYSLLSFLAGEQDEPSLLPFQFFQHVTALLPADYFALISLYRMHDPQRCPIASMLQFLAIVPHGAMRQVPSVACGTRVFLAGTLTITELKAVLAHPFHPSVKLEFDSFPFDDNSVPLIEMLKEAEHLRSVKIPYQLFESLQGPFQPNRSNNLTMRASVCLRGPDDTPSLLAAITTIHNAENVSIECRDDATADGLRVLGHYIRPFLDGSLKSKRLRVQLNPQGSSVHKIREWAAGLAVPFKSNNLTMFNLELKDEPDRLVAVPFMSNHSTTFNMYLLPREEDDPVEKDEADHLNHIEQWDAELFPSLALNYCGDKLMQPLAERVMSWAIKCINHGLVYHKTTGHKPFDMSMTNAGLIYAVVRIKSGVTQDLAGWHGRLCRNRPPDVVSSLSGNKRPAPSLDFEL